jgi:hypothetical protein
LRSRKDRSRRRRGDVYKFNMIRPPNSKSIEKINQDRNANILYERKKIIME